MTRAVLFAVLLLASTTLAESAGKLAPARSVEIMLGDVAVMASAKDDRCTVTLDEASTPQGYKIGFFDDKCEKAFPVMGKVVAWRVYTDGTMAFTDATGQDLITFKKGKGFQRRAVKKVDGIERIWSQQEFAE